VIAEGKKEEFSIGGDRLSPFIHGGVEFVKGNCGLPPCRVMAAHEKIFLEKRRRTFDRQKPGKHQQGTVDRQGGPIFIKRGVDALPQGDGFVIDPVFDSSDSKGRVLSQFQGSGT